MPHAGTGPFKVISVIISTCNRLDLLPGCLQSLVEQSADPGSFEVVVVDNASTDGTLRFLEGYRSGLRLRVLQEPQPGMSIARNLGGRSAAGEYLAFLDDDARAHPDWIQTATACLARLPRPVHALGGPILPFYTTPRPAWFHDSYEARRASKPEGFVKPGDSFSGSNMIWHRDALAGVGWFNRDLGAVEGSLRLGEESEAFQRLWHATPDARLYFSSKLVVYHWVPPWKMSLQYQLKRRYRVGHTLAQISLAQSAERSRVCGSAMREMMSATVRGLPRLARGRAMQGRLLDYLGPIWVSLGRLGGAFTAVRRQRAA